MPSILYTAGEIQQAIEKETGASARLEGRQETPIELPLPLEEAGEKSISFLNDPKRSHLLKASRAACLLISEKLAKDTAGFTGTKIIAQDVSSAWAAVLGLWNKKLSDPHWGIHPSAQVAKSARLGKTVSIGALAVVEEEAVIGDGSKIYPQSYVGKKTEIGSECVIYPQAVIRERVKIGNRCIIHAGVVIGSDGFGYATAEGRHRKVPQIGTVEIGDDVEIGANSTVDRAQMGVTRIGSGTKIDNMVQVAHNVTVGENCIFAAQVGIAGSTKIGNSVILGGQAGVKDHVEIADGTIVGGQGGVIGDVKTKDILWGTPARNHRESIRLEALLNRLPEMYEDFKKRQREPNNG